MYMFQTRKGQWPVIYLTTSWSDDHIAIVGGPTFSSYGQAITFKGSEASEAQNKRLLVFSFSIDDILGSVFHS